MVPVTLVARRRRDKRTAARFTQSTREENPSRPKKIFLMESHAADLRCIFDATGGEIASQDDWFTGPQVGLLKYYKLDPKSAQEPAIILDLPAGKSAAEQRLVGRPKRAAPSCAPRAFFSVGG